ncbi:MAG: FTR1 family protein [Gammaproteobacteria bacterium]|nr:FTR1 family protein [Gammaproteobacteria bacterium]MBL4898905.1 FTR1 family protein [Colwellia sp.]
MLLDIIIIVLRETLEASILIAVLLSVSLNQSIKFNWAPMAILLGLAGAVIYGSNLGAISEWFDYAGQEVVSAGLQLVVYLLVCLLIPLQWQSMPISKGLMRILMFAIVYTALIREGGELYVFYTGFLQKEAVLLSALTSGFIGLAVGLSVGAIVYYALVIRGEAQAKKMHIVVLTLVAAGMMLQATQLLIQVDWLSSGEPLWDSNWLISESSIIGQVVYAIFGYEATPSLVEVGVYGLSITGVITVASLYLYCCKKRDLTLKSASDV